MIRRAVVLFALAASSVTALTVGACGGDNGTTDGGSDATTPDTGGGDVKQNDSAPPTDSGNDADAAPVPCVGSDAGCDKCCAALYPDAATTLLGYEATCACTSPGDCQSNQVCGSTLCKGNLPDTTCEDCLRDAAAGDCRKNAGLACLSNAGCAPLAQCDIECSNSQPTDAGGGD